MFGELQDHSIPHVTTFLTHIYCILGVHSWYDVAAGAILGLLVVQGTHAAGDWVDHLVYVSPRGLWVSLALLLAFVTIYPKSAKGE